MGGSYSSHIVNQSETMIKILLREGSEAEGRYTTQVIEPGKHVVIPSDGSRLTLFAYSRSSDIWSEKAEAVYTAASNTNFIVDHGPDGNLQIWRSVYGNINQKNEGPELDQ